MHVAITVKGESCWRPRCCRRHAENKEHTAPLFRCFGVWLMNKTWQIQFQTIRNMALSWQKVWRVYFLTCFMSVIFFHKCSHIFRHFLMQTCEFMHRYSCYKRRKTDDLHLWHYWCSLQVHKSTSLCHITNTLFSYTAQWRFQSAIMEVRVCFSQVNWHKDATFYSNSQHPASLTLQLHSYLCLRQAGFRLINKSA